VAVPITGAGGLFTRLGHQAGISLNILVSAGYAGAAPDYAVTIPSKVQTVVADYAAGTPAYGVIQGQATPQGGPSTNTRIMAASSAWQNVHRQYLSYYQSLAVAELVDIVNIDAAQKDRTLPTALAALINNTLQGSFHVQASSPSAGAQTNGNPTPKAPYAASGNTGPVIVFSFKDLKGNPLDNVYAETLRFAVTADAQQGGAVKWREPVLVSGQSAVVTDTLSPLWPSGSGTSVSVNCADSAGNAGVGGNLLQNSNFASYSTADYPDNWVAAGGTVGTAIKNGAGTGFLGTTSLEFVGDGATAIAVKQPFGVSASTSPGAGGSPANLLALPSGPLALNFWLKLSAAATGWLQADLVDSTATVINDDSGTANSFHLDLSTLADTNWHNVNGVFRLPALNPANTPVALRLWCPTGHELQAGKNLFTANVALTQMQQLSPKGAAGTGVGGGPFVAIFAGNLQTLAGDSWTVAVANTWGNWVQLFQRWYGIGAMGLRLPTSGGALIDDVIGPGHLIS